MRITQKGHITEIHARRHIGIKNLESRFISITFEEKNIQREVTHRPATKILESFKLIKIKTACSRTVP
ncbi:hypothetical protein DRW42_27895 [Pedobacter miscanthi]|uniref:Uncharacterized protein n=1 Tax=Pedobacter miscanthi TaxID=2259170 RepID=A0A366KM55_9SPHI|nr:hypothetical protein DRW42_27895 [Pedobacter miscanthi]